MNILKILLILILKTSFVILFIIFLIALFILKFFIINKKDKINLKKSKKILIRFDGIIDTKITSINKKDVYTIYELREILLSLKNTKIEEIILDVDNMNLPISKVEELEDVFDELRKTKKIVAYAEDYDKESYSIALLADKICMVDTRNVSLHITGYNKVLLYYKNFLKKIGINVDVIHIGDYKSAGENFSKSKMSVENRNSLSKILDSVFYEFINKIEKKRNIKVRDLILNGKITLITPFEAKKLKLIDELCDFIDENDDEIITLKKYAKKYKKKKNKSKNVIAVLNLEGDITSTVNTKTINSKYVYDEVERINDIKNLKGVILRINSPGGSALESEKILRILKKIEVPIYVSMSSVCASGGYYISTVGEKIYANKSTITGSIGVVAIYPKLKKVLEKLEINPETLKIGENSDIYSYFSDLKYDSREKIKDHMLEIYKEFKSHVMKSRNMTEEVLEPLAGGRIYLGEEALKINLIDKIGGINTVISDMVTDLDLKDYKLDLSKKSEKIQETVKNILPFSIYQNIDLLLNNKLNILYYLDID